MSGRTATQAELLRWRDRALWICDEPDSMALAGFRRDIKVSTKPDRTLVPRSTS
jgi:hypothetical protein